VRPGEPIPASATAIHGIDDTAVAAASTFAQAWPGFAACLGELVIGHSVGFDLAILQRECARCGAGWPRVNALDTRLLAEIAEPNLADYSLDTVAIWLGVKTGARHSAAGDALTTARVFRALVPKLRERGVRTVAEAMRICGGLKVAADAQQHAGWSELTAPPAAPAGEGAAGSIDSYPYRHRVASIMTAPARFAPPGATLGAVLGEMARERISSLFVTPAAASALPVAENTGIVTERDALRAIARHGAGALALPVEQVMSAPLVAIAADDFAHTAIGRMNRLRIRHLGVTDATGRVVGALSARDLLHLRADSGLILGDEIDHAADARDLARAWGKLAHVSAELAREGLTGREVAAVISRGLAAMTRRAATLAEQRTRGELGDLPCPYALVLLGSAGRGESLLAMDQDNAIVFAEGTPDGAQDRWFAALGTAVAATLHEAGIPYCKGGVMAKNAPWRGSLATWGDRVRHWITRSDPQDLLSVDIFFDLLAVHGDTRLADALRDEALDAAASEIAFIKLLVESSPTPSPGLNWFGRFNAVAGRIDLKKTALLGITSVARALAIRHRVHERSTSGRLAAIKALGLGMKRDLDALIDAHATCLDLILRQQIDDIEHGIAPTSSVATARLSRRDRERLRAAFGAVSHLEEMSRDLLFKD
jgi:DNA polymerase-3 subunit epsilon/CBS domain-containing protein